ncbi:solute carrier family 22 member 21-like [Mercenaria mercenaria]|uniref:solute carrier family 22 member 21-like n=1 Tax=Mercenaria mercenaria TaxID=6596 RepID=UPI00234F9366|nr:solute carrier family 22 member 21-like [Mercenaria mercenaria]
MVAMFYATHLKQGEFEVKRMGLGLVSYGIKYGIQALSGNIFFNLFLFNLCGIPSKGIALWLQNRFGRRITAIICYTIVGISGFIVGVVQTVEAPNRDALTNGFALLAHTGITMAWGPVQTMTIELYPTVVRNIGFGTLSVMGRIGAMIGPQLVYLLKKMNTRIIIAVLILSLMCCVNTQKFPKREGRYREGFPGGFFVGNRYYSYRDPQTRSSIGNGNDVLGGERRRTFGRNW